MSQPEVPEGVKLGVPELDMEHGLQFRLLRALQDALAGSAESRVLDLIDQLDDTSNMHFLLEETLMIRRAYPGYPGHRQEHDRLIETLRALRNAVIAEGTGGPDPSGVLDAIAQWLVSHIQTFDRALAAYLLAHPGQGDDSHR